MKKCVSIIIPVYNTEKYLRECLDSVFNQTFNDIEVIIINDGSKDKSDDIIKSYMKKYKNIIYINQKNQGQSVARNNGLKYAQGEFVFYLDSDDYIELDCIENLYNKAKNNGADIIIMGHKKLYLESKYPRVEDVIFDINENHIYSGKDVAQMMLNSEILGYSCDKFFKLENLKNNNFYYEPNKYIEDLFPVFKEIYNSKKIMFINKPLYNYRQRENSSSNLKNTKLLKDFIEANNCVLDYIKNNRLRFDENTILRFKTIFFAKIIMIYNNCEEYKLNRYKNFYKLNYDLYEPSLIYLITHKDIKISTKISIILWKLKVYHQFMPILKNIKYYIQSKRSEGNVYNEGRI